MKYMHNSTLPLVIRNTSSRKSGEVVITRYGLALVPKKTAVIDRINHLIVYRNPRFGWATRPKLKANIKQIWLPVSSTPTMLGIYLEDEAKSNALCTGAIVSGKNRQKSPAILGEGKFERDERLAQLRYSLLVLAFVGACSLLYCFMVDVLVSGKQNHDFSAPNNVAAETQPHR